MTSPLLNEHYIKDTLALPMEHAHIGQLVVANMLAILDSYDRKILREEFAKVLTAGLEFQDMSARLDLVINMKKLQVEGTLQDSTFEEAIDGLTKRANHWRNRLVAMIELVSQCPENGDSIN